MQTTRTLPGSVFLATTLLLLLASAAGGAQLVRDINATFSAQGGAGSLPLELGNVAILVVDDGVHGAELWATDGTPAGTRLVRDINPGPSTSDIASLTALNGVAYFLADDGTNGTELWRSDGTTAGTAIVANIGPGAAGMGGISTPSQPLPTLNGVLYFSADEGQGGTELWRSDGTSSGTYRLRDIRPGTAGSGPEEFAVAGSQVYFVADDGTSGSELWTTDGTVSGTLRVADIFPGSTGSGVFRMVVAGNNVFFRADDGSHGVELWRANASGATLIDVNTTGPSNAGSSPHSLIALGDGVLFAGTTGGSVGVPAVQRLYRGGGSGSSVTPLADLSFGVRIQPLLTVAGRVIFRIDPDIGNAFVEMWTSDGTPAGTMPLRPNGVPLFFPTTTFSVALGNNEGFFFASSGTPADPVNIWRTDGSRAGTRLYASVGQPFVAIEMARFGSKLYFRAGRFSDPGGDELWTTDGTVAGTERVIDIRPGPDHSMPAGLSVALNRLFFSADDGVTGFEPYVSDGTSAGTTRLGDLNSAVATASSEPAAMTPFGNGILFQADDGVHGNEIWTSDGTFAGTRLVSDIAPGPQSASFTVWMARLGNTMLFQADDGSSGLELWRTDGTAAGTLQVADIAPGPQSSSPASAFGTVVVNGIAYFAADNGTNGRELWRSDGTGAGTRMVTELTPGASNANFMMMGAIGGRVLFAFTNAGPLQLWGTDGTSGGTAAISADLEPAVVPFADPVILDGRLYFSAREASSGLYQLWSSDGTPGGTRQVTDLGANIEFNPLQIGRAGNLLVVNACVTNAGCALYGTDGTNAGTRVIANSAAQSPFATDGTRLFYTATVAHNEIGLFVTDGTSAGTREFVPSQVDLNPGSQFGWFAGSLFFTVEDAALGPVIWRSDGTDAGTFRFADIDPGVSPDRPPSEYLVVGARLFVTAGHVDRGNELYVVESTQPNAMGDAVGTSFNTPLRINVLANDATVTGALNRSSVEIRTAPSSGTATVDSATGEILYTPNTGFTGVDTLEYRVRDDQGRASNTARVSVIVASVAGGAPGTAPTPTPPAPNPPPTSGGGGGGGAFDWWIVMLLAPLFLARRTRGSPSS